MSRHTPGPWVSFGTRRAHGAPGFEGLVRVDGATGAGNVIALVCTGGPGAASGDKDGIEANARLIAAAPELLAALRDLVEVHRQIVHGERTNGVPAKLLRDAEAAVAKAGGR